MAGRLYKIFNEALYIQQVGYVSLDKILTSLSSVNLIV